MCHLICLRAPETLHKVSQKLLTSWGGWRITGYIRVAPRRGELPASKWLNLTTTAIRMLLGAHKKKGWQ